MQEKQLVDSLPPFHNLTEEIVFSILDFLESDPQSKKSFTLVCKSFHSIESRHRNTLKPIQIHSISTPLRRYLHIHRVDFTNCPRVTDAVLVNVSNAYARTLKSVNLSKSKFFGHVGLLNLATNCVGLVELDLSNSTELRDSGAAAIAEAKSLEKLWLARCKLVSDIGIGCIAVGCKKLKLVCLKWCVRVTDLGIGLLARKCQELRSLDLSYLPITKTCLFTVLQLRDLKELTLVGCPGIDDECLTNLKDGVKSLEVLDISHCHNITDNGLGSLINDAKSLHRLLLSYCFSVTYDLTKCFYRLSKLETIKLDGCWVSEATMTAIADCCESLKELSLFKSSGVNDAGLSYIARKHTQLRKLDITCCKEITSSAVENVVVCCPYLTSLRMEACTVGFHNASRLIGQCCQSLEDLNVTEILINDEDLEAISRCSKLSNLKLGLCVEITDCGLSDVGTRCRNLVELDLYRCVGITDVGIAVISGGCPSLEMINMAYCDKVTDASLVSLSHCQQLKVLEIRGCDSLSSVGLSAVAKGCRQLTVLDIKKCHINDTGLINLAQYSRCLKQINIAYCPVTDNGLLGLASIKCLQNLTILHIVQLSPEGLVAALLACKGLMKVKLNTNYISLIPESAINEMRERGCAIHWRNKPFFMLSPPFIDHRNTVL